MAAPLTLTLDAAARAEVERRYEAAAEPEARTRYQMVLLAADGLGVARVAALVRRSPDTVRRVLRRYRAEGPAGVPHRPRPGMPARRTAAWEAELRRVIELDPRAVGVPSAVWTTRRLADYLAGQTGHRASVETVRQQLHRADYVCKRPTWSLKRKREEQPDWAKNG
jgi:transposase